MAVICVCSASGIFIFRALIKLFVCEIGRFRIGESGLEVAFKLSTRLRLNHFKDHYLLLDFRVSWCGSSRAESLALTGLYKRLRNKNFGILNFSLDEKMMAG